MASWDDLMSFVRVRYEIMRQVDDGELWFNLPTGGERTQIVSVRQVTGEDGDALHASFEELLDPPEPGTDTALLRDGHPTLTELISVSERPGLLDGISVPARRAG